MSGTRLMILYGKFDGEISMEETSNSEITVPIQMFNQVGVWMGDNLLCGRTIFNELIDCISELTWKSTTLLHC